MSRFLILLLMTAMAATAWSSQGITLYEDAAFEGQHLVLNADLADLSVIRLNRIGSIRVPAGYKLELYARRDFTELVTTTRHDLTDMALTRKQTGVYGSIRLTWLGADWPDLPEDTTVGVTLFKQAGWQGDYEVFVAGKANLDKTWFGNNQACSLLVAPGYRATLYTRRHFRGARTELGFGRYNLAEIIGCGTLSSIRIDGPDGPLPEPPEAHQDHDHGHDWGAPPVNVGVVVDVELDDDVGDVLAVAAGALLIGAAIHAIVEENRENHPPGPGVTFYSDTHFGGEYQTFYKDIRRMYLTHFGNNAAASVTVPNGYELVLYDKSRFRGRTITLFGDVENLDETDLGSFAVSSFQLRRRTEKLAREQEDLR